MMLRRFESIRDCGIFEDFRWGNSAPDFERINLIYGANGSGKSSLARALDSLSSDPDAAARLSIRMSDPNKSNDRVSDRSPDSEFDRVFVFCDGYVSRSHRFDGDTESDGGATLDAVLTLGEPNIEDDDRISEIETQIKSGEESLTQAKLDEKASEKALSDEYRELAKLVVDTLKRAGGIYSSNGSYSMRTAKERFSGRRDDWKLLPEDKVDAAKATINSDVRRSVAVRSYSLSVPQDLQKAATDALRLSPVSVVLDTLEGRDDAASWVEKGQKLHEGTDTCIFCAGDLTPLRKKQIAQHFSDEVTAAQSELDSLLEEVERLETSVRTRLGDGEIAGSLFDDLGDDFRAAYEAASRQETDLGTWLSSLRVALVDKRENVLSTSTYEVSEAPVLNGSKLEEAIAAHNARVADHSKLVEDEAKTLELHLLKEAEPKIGKLSEAATTAKETKQTHEDGLVELRDELSALRNKEGDPLPSTDVLTTEVARIFGRNELLFELLPDGKHYRITRHGQPARDLSTGERTAIALIHFLERVNRSAAQTGKPIVVVDDPVSSFDSGTAMGISTYIWSEAVTKGHIEQIFLLTHDFDLFRQWDIQIDGLPGARGAANGKGFTSCVYELKALHEGVKGPPKRVPAFSPWPRNEIERKKVRSTYHHAFVKAVEAHRELTSDPSLERKLDALLLYPNMLRRMLETFTTFKDPASTGDFTKAMRQVGGSLEASGFSGDADALRLHLTRFTHANSHAEAQANDATASPDEIGTILSAVFTFMHAVDTQHFEGLCEVVGVAPASLLLEAS